jgi:tetratricopeptide (TPR) repeat protein
MGANEFFPGVPILLALLAAPLPQQTVAPPTPQHEANFDTERAQANQLWLADKFIEALPLYEDLCRQDQTLAVFAERHGFGLIKKAGTIMPGPEQSALQKQAYAELYRAKKLGDNSELLQSVLGDQTKSGIGAVLSNIPLTGGYTHKPTPQAATLENQAQVAFNNNDFSNALTLYSEASAQDPLWYDPLLFAGDVYFRQGRQPEAAQMFAKAIAIDPDRETAYRYWGDLLLLKAGDIPAAKVKFEEAVVAEPYSRAAAIGLLKWARYAKATYAPPQIARPNFATNHGALVADPALAAETANGRASWLIYERVRVAHGAISTTQLIVAGATSATGVLTPSGYRHSLAEEMDALTQMLTAVRQQLNDGTLTDPGLDPGLKLLLQLQNDKMLEPWILMTAFDAGTRQDYFAYRPAHREQLKAYLNRYVVHEATQTTTP